MIESLKGLHETVNFKKDTQIRLYNNDEAENYPPHWHDAYELIMPTESAYRVVCGEQTYDLRPNDVIIIAPTAIHELFAPPTGQRIIFQPSPYRIDFNEMDLIDSIINPAILITPEKYPDIHQKIHDLMLQICDEYFEARPFSEPCIYSYFLDILVQIGRDYHRNNQPGIYTGNKQREYFDKIKLVCDYVNEHFGEEFSLEEAADMAGFSKFHFTRLFKQFTNTTYYKYVSQKRIAHAKQLLLDDKYTIMEVAYLSGFSSNAAFTRMFKTITGRTPYEFRKMYNAYKPS